PQADRPLACATDSESLQSESAGRLATAHEDFAPAARYQRKPSVRWFHFAREIAPEGTPVLSLVRAYQRRALRSTLHLFLASIATFWLHLDAPHLGRGTVHSPPSAAPRLAEIPEARA